MRWKEHKIYKEDTLSQSWNIQWGYPLTELIWNIKCDDLTIAAPKLTIAAHITNATLPHRGSGVHMYLRKHVLPYKWLPHRNYPRTTWNNPHTKCDYPHTVTAQDPFMHLRHLQEHHHASPSYASFCPSFPYSSYHRSYRWRDPLHWDWTGR